MADIIYRVHTDELAEREDVLCRTWDDAATWISRDFKELFTFVESDEMCDEEDVHELHVRVNCLRILPYNLELDQLVPLDIVKKACYDTLRLRSELMKKYNVPIVPSGYHYIDGGPNLKYWVY